MQIALSRPQRVNTTALVKEPNKKGERREDGGRGTSLIKRSSILGAKMLPISIFEWAVAFRGRVRVSACVLPGFVSFFSDVPGPCDEILAQI